MKWIGVFVTGEWKRGSEFEPALSENPRWIPVPTPGVGNDSEIATGNVKEINMRCVLKTFSGYLYSLSTTHNSIKDFPPLESTSWHHASPLHLYLPSSKGHITIFDVLRIVAGIFLITPGQREYPALSSNISVIFTPHPQSTIPGIFSTVLIFESFTCFACCIDVVSSTGFTRFIGRGVQETVIFLRGLQKRVLEISGTAY